MEIAMGDKTTVVSSDGFELDAWLAVPEGTPKGSVLVIQEIFGVNAHIREVVDGYAADGYAALAPAHPDAKVAATPPPDAGITQPPPAPAPRVASQESSQQTPDWPRPGQIIECVWTKGTALTDGDVDRCVVESIRDPVPHKKRKAGVPEHLADQCYAQLKSLIKLAGATDQPYETVPESDPRPKHVHLKYKLDLADHGRTWRILPCSVGKKASQRESVGATVSAMSDLTNN